MRAYKCEQCNELVEGKPANRGLHQYVSCYGLKSLTVKADVCTEGKCAEVDLCPECFIKDLCAFIAYWKAGYPMSGDSQRLNKLLEETKKGE